MENVKSVVFDMVRQVLLLVGFLLGFLPYDGAADGVQVRELGGLVGERMRACYETAVKQTDVKMVVDVFKKRDAVWDWKTEFWGKWMHSAPVLAAYYGDAEFKAKIAAATRELIATQTPDGYIGNYPPERQCPTQGEGWDVWGRKYTMLGLIHQYDATGDKALLATALKMLDHLATQTGPDKAKQIDDIGNYRGMPSLSILEPVMWLYNRTHEKRCLAFADYIVERMEKGPGLLSKAKVDVAVRFPHPPIWWRWPNGGKAYEMMSCYQGLLEYARVANRPDCRAAAISAGENIATNEINVCGSGASSECWYYGARRQTSPAIDSQEGCVTVTWMRLCEALGKTTGEAKWADRFERAFYNAYLGALKNDGSLLAKYSSLEGRRRPGDCQCGLPTNCCTANGPRGFVEFLNYMAETRAGVLVLNLYAPAIIEFELGGEKGAIKVETEWPKAGELRLTWLGERKLEFPLCMRVPGKGCYRTLRRTWTPGETVVEKLPLTFSTINQNGCIAFLRGPVVFARDARLQQGGFDAPVWFPGAQPQIKCVEPPAYASQAIEVSLAEGFNHTAVEERRLRKITFIDYASAGNTWGDDSCYRVWLRRTFDAREASSF